MKTKQFFAVLLASILLTGATFARDLAPVINYDNIAVVAGAGKTLTVERVKQAIQTGATARGWSIAQAADGKMVATLIVHSKHSVSVEIGYTADRYSLHYKDSLNMKFASTAPSRKNGVGPAVPAEENGQPVIHPNYNKWVLQLRESIQVELGRL